MSAENASGTVVTPGNVTISDTVKLVSKANRTSWRNINIGNSYKNSYNYNRTNESHLIKNSEWGAMAYLTHSQYGRNGNEVKRNTSWTTAYGGELESTTGNIYGIYDTNGGAWERVAAWDKLSTSGNLTSYGNITIDGYTFGVSGGVSSKYATVYENGTTTYTGTITKTVCKTGDAMKETYTGNDGKNRSWFWDLVEVPSNNFPFLERGGDATNEDAGICGSFANEGTAGGNYTWSGWRVSMIGD